MSRTDRILESLIARGLLDTKTDASIKPLTGGYHNYVYRLQSGSHIDWVIKQYVSHSSVPLFPVLPDHEAGALQHFQGIEVAPEFVGFLPDNGDGAILIYEYVDGDMWQNDVASVARMLAKIHQTPLSGNFRYLYVWPTELIAQTQSIQAQMQDPNEAYEILSDYMVDCDCPDTIVRSLVHTDCGPGNIIVGDQGPRLIDWQCPGLGDPIEDLVNFTSPAIQILYGLEPLNKQQRDEFFSSYGDAKIEARFNQIGNHYRMRFVAYCLYREESLHLSQPDISGLYRKALLAELALMKSLKP